MIFPAAVVEAEFPRVVSESPFSPRRRVFVLVPLEIVAREDNPRLPQTEKKKKKKKKKDEKPRRKTTNGGGDTRLEAGREKKGEKKRKARKREAAE